MTLLTHLPLLSQQKVTGGMSNGKTQAERIAALETQMGYIKAELEQSNRKLDDLLALRNKGLGAFWLMTMLFGTSVFGLFSWFKGLN